MGLTPNDFYAFYDAPPKLNFSFQVFKGSLHWGGFFQSEHAFLLYPTTSLAKTHGNHVIFDSYDTIQVSL